MDKIIRAGVVAGSRKISRNENKENVINKIDGHHDSILDDIAVVIDNNQCLKCSEYEESLKIQIANFDKLQEMYFSQSEELKIYSDKIKELESSNKNDGFEAGYQHGLEAAEKENLDKLHELEQLIISLKDNANIQILNMETIAIEVAFAAICKIINDGHKYNDFIISNIKNTLSHIRDAQEVTLYLSPKDYDVIKKDISDHFTKQKINIEQDKRIKVGGCIVETSSGVWDGRLEVQLQRLIDAVSKTEQSDD